MKNYKYYEVTTCRLAIRLCVGYGANGRKKHRTFSMKNINPNASWDGIMKVIRALAPLLEFPIVDVQKVTSRKIFFYEDTELSEPVLVLLLHHEPYPWKPSLYLSSLKYPPGKKRSILAQAYGTRGTNATLYPSEHRPYN